MSDVNMTATPALDAKGNVNWTLCNTSVNPNQCGGAGNYPAINLPAKSGAWNIHFTVTDTNQTGVIFAADPDAMQIQPTANGYPQKGVYTGSGQIEPYNRQSDTKIKVHDNNSQQGHQLFTYQLNFTLNGKSVTSIDPIIDNGGCCQLESSFWSETRALFGNPVFDVWLGIAFLAGIAATLVVRAVRSRNSAQANRTR